MITSLLLAIQINLAIIFHKTAEKSTALFVFLDTHQEAALLRGFQYKKCYYLYSCVACILMHDQIMHGTLFNPFGCSRFRATSCTLRFTGADDSYD